MKLRELVTVLSYELDAAKLKAAENAFSNLEKRAEKVADVAGNIGKKLTTYVTLPVLGLATAATYAANRTGDAITALRNRYGTLGDEAEATSKRIASKFGLSARAAAELVTQTGAILSNFDLTDKQALKMSETVQNVSADLAAFLKLEGGTEAASEAITRALGGQTKGLRALGIVLTEEEVKQKILTMTMNGATFSTESQAKAMATLALVQERASKATGQYEQQAAGLDETARRLKGKIEDVAASFGKFLLPAVEWAALKIEKLLNWVNGLSDRFKIFLMIMAGAAAILGPVLLGIAGIASAVGFLAQGISFLLPFIAAMNIALLPLIIKIVLIAAAIAALVLIIEDIYTYIQGGPSVFGAFIAKLQQWGNSLSAWAKSVGDSITTFLKPAMDMINKITGYANKGANFVSGIASSVSGFLTPSAPMAKSPAPGASLFQQNSIKMSVDARGNSPSETTEAVRSGVETGLSDTLRGSRQNVVPSRRY